MVPRIELRASQTLLLSNAHSLELFTEMDTHRYSWYMFRDCITLSSVDAYRAHRLVKSDEQDIFVCGYMCVNVCVQAYASVWVRRSEGTPMTL